MNQQLLRIYIETSNSLKSRVRAEDGVISTETAIVGAVILTAAAAVAAKFSGLFDSALEQIPESIDG